MTKDHTPDLRKHLQEQIAALDQSAIVAITDSKGLITYINEKFCELSEYSKEELIGKTHRIINSGYHGKEFFKEMWETILAGQVWRGEICNKAKSGRLYWVDTTIVPFFDETQKIEKLIAIRYEITARKKAEELVELERRKLIESEKMASIGILSAGIAHELGNPLGAIRGRLEMMLDMVNSKDMDQAFAAQSLQKMIESVDRISKIIRALKGFSRDGSHDEMQSFDIVELIDDIVELSRQKCAKGKIDIRLNLPSLHLSVMGSETEVGQIVVNLFNNAFDSVKDSHQAWIQIDLQDEGEKVLLNIQDSGPGVPESIESKIFDPFYTTKEVGKGTGLGLSLCRSFAEHHGGTLSLKREISPSCFQLILPKS